MTDKTVPKEPPPFRLDRADVQTALWKKLSAHLEERRDALRRLNDDPKFDPVQTAVIRGQLRAIKNLLALANPSPGTMVADEADGE